MEYRLSYFLFIIYYFVLKKDINKTLILTNKKYFINANNFIIVILLFKIKLIKYI